MGHFVDSFEKKRCLRLRCCCYVWPGASGTPGGPVLVGGVATLGVLASGVALVAFLPVGTGGVVVLISDTPSMRPAVACGVGALLLASVLRAPTVPTAAAATISALALLGVKLGLEGLDLVGQIGVGGGEVGIGGNQLLKDSFVVGSGTGEIVEGVVDRVEEAGGLAGIGMA